MKLRVAYDISVLGEHFGRSEAQHGILRVTEELLYQLANRDEIDLTAVGLCGEDPLFSSIMAENYYEAHSDRLGGRYAHSVKSRLGLAKLYLSIFAGYTSTAPVADASMFKRGARAALYRLRARGLAQLDRRFDQDLYDVFHSSFLPLPPQDLTRGTPRVLTIYDLIPINRPDFVADYHVPFFHKILSSIDINNDWVTCISEYTKMEFCDFTGMAANRVFVTPLAAGASFRPISDREIIAAARARYGVPPGQYLLSLAAPQPRKNLTHLIRCFFRLLEEQPELDVNLVLAGSKEQGWLSDDIFAAAQDLAKHRARVVFAGFVADEDLAALFSGAASFVFPSLYEGFGLPPLEAMACGAPVIAADATAVPEVVGGAGILVAPRDEDALCEAMFRVLSDQQLQRELGRRSLEKAAQFSWEKCADETTKAYRAATDEKSQRQPYSSKP